MRIPHVPSDPVHNTHIEQVHNKPTEQVHNNPTEQVHNTHTEQVYNKPTEQAHNKPITPLYYFRLNRRRFGIFVSNMTTAACFGHCWPI